MQRRRPHLSFSRTSAGQPPEAGARRAAVGTRLAPGVPRRIGLLASGSLLLGLSVAWGGCSSDDAETGPTPTTSANGGAGGQETTSSSSSTTQTPTDGGAGGAGGTALGWYGELPALNNDSECMEWGAVSPNPDEAGHLCAVRLTPPSTPFEVTEIQYELWGEGDCDNSFGHRVEIFVATTTSPPASPTEPVVLDVPALGSNVVPIRIVQVALPTPIVLNADEHLFVAVELPTPDTSCVAACGGAEDDDRDYWSNATAAPYDWQTLASFGVGVHARIGANGAPQ